MGKLLKNRTLLGNIALVVFLSFMFTLTFGTLPQAEAQTNLEKGDFDIADGLTADQAAVQDKNGNWVLTSGTDSATVQAIANNEVKFNIQIMTDQAYDSLWFAILDGETALSSVYLKNLTEVTYQTYESVYSVYQFDYTWDYDDGLDFENDYSLNIYASETIPVSIILDLEGPPDEPGGGPGGAPSTKTTVDTGDITTDDGKATLEVDADKVEKLLDDSKVAVVEFAIPADVAEEGAVELSANVLEKVMEAEKPAVFSVGDAAVALDPGDIVPEDLKTLADEGATVKVSIVKSEAPLPGYTSLKIAGEVYDVKIEVIGADGVRKGSISSFSKPVTLILPYDPAKLGSTSEDMLSIFRYNETTGSWDQVTGSIVDKDSKTVTVNSYSLSKYAVMAYNAGFTDIAGHWAEADIKTMAAKGIVKGMTATTFAPAANVTRAEFATLLVRALNIPVSEAAGGQFKDVYKGAWYAGAVETAAANGLLKGYADGTFKPKANISRQELAMMVANALKFRNAAASLTAAEINAQLEAFADRNEISNWAQEAAAIAVEKGIVNGRTSSRFAARATAERCEAVVMVKRMLSVLGEI